MSQAVLAGQVQREQLVASLPGGQQRFEAMMAAVAQVNAALNRAEALEAFSLQASQKTQRLDSTVAAGAHTVQADRGRVIQVLSNLIGNAVKFTPEGGHIHVCTEPDGNACVCLSVSDTGPGIARELLPQLFDAFAQAKDAVSFGTGLGLSIATGIVEADGGKIAVDSTPGEGQRLPLHFASRTDMKGDLCCDIVTGKQARFP